MVSSSTVARARAVFAEILTALAGGVAFHYVINCDVTLGFSLCARLGMCQRDYETLLVAANFASIDINGVYKIKSKELEQYITGGDFIFMQDRIKLDKKRCELAAHIEGRKQSDDRTLRGWYHTIRIGRASNDTPASLLDQKDDNNKLIQTPPFLSRQLRNQQRSFGREAVPLIFDTIYRDENVYKQFMKDDDDTPTQPTPIYQFQLNLQLLKLILEIKHPIVVLQRS